MPVSGEITLLPDDEPFELPQCNAEEAIALLESWYDPAEAEDQRETLEFLMRHLDEDRFTERKLFP